MTREDFSLDDTVKNLVQVDSKRINE